MTGRYDDIIDLPHYEPKRHARMDMEKRAAQFKPFAAVSGHTEAIEETARLTDEKVILEEDDLTELDEKIALLDSHLKEKPEITLVYFMKDALKEGGSYREITGCVRKIDSFSRALIMADGTVIPFGNIMSISGNFFDLLNAD